MEKDFDSWNIVKKDLENKDSDVFFHRREIWWCSLGANLGFEQDGRSDTFERPILIIKKFNNDIFVGLPITTQAKKGKFYHITEYAGKKYSVILSQVRLIY